MAIKEPKKQFDFVVHRNGFNENVAVFDESKWLAMAQCWVKWKVFARA